MTINCSMLFSIIDVYIRIIYIHTHTYVYIFSTCHQYNVCECASLFMLSAVVFTGALYIIIKILSPLIAVTKHEGLSA